MPPPLRTLIVEDIPSDAKLVVQQLRREGYEVEWSRVDTEPAYRAALGDWRPDVILSDCNLPVFSGAQALEILQQSGLDVPLIIVSGTIGEETAAELIRQGAADYVSKDKPIRLGMAVSRAMAEAELRRDRGRALDEVKTSEARFRALFESNVIGIIVADRTGRIVEANSYFLSMVGRSNGDLPIDWVSMAPDEARSREREVLKDLQLQDRSTPWESEFIRKDGKGVPILIGGARLPGDSLVCFTVDLTPIKTVQANLEHAKLELEGAIERLRQTQDALIAEERLHALGQMAAGIAHDFNNTLSPIIGLSELILSKPQIIHDRDKVLKYVRTINHAGSDAALVVRRLRDYYRDASDDLEIEVVDLKKVVEDTMKLTQSRWRDQAMATNTKYRIVTKLDSASVAGHASELREMLVNLIFNALDAMPDGGDLTIGVQPDANRPGIVILEVKDTGIGMTPDVRKRCLEPFFTTKGAAGTGLGLATSYGIVKRHHGEIQIESQAGHGTRMIVALPAVASSSVVEVRKQVPRPLGLRILVIDDEELVRNVVAEFLLFDGHKVALADGPGVGLRKLKAGQYDLVITDRAMPEMSGDQLALRAKRAAPHVPILMLTGFGEFMNAANDLPEGVDIVVSKPVTLAALRDAITFATAPRNGHPAEHIPVQSLRRTQHPRGPTNAPAEVVPPNS